MAAAGDGGTAGLHAPDRPQAAHHHRPASGAQLAQPRLQCPCGMGQQVQGTMLLL